MPNLIRLLQTLAAAILTALLSTPSMAADVTIYEISIQQNRFVPDRIEVPAGQKFKLHVKNEGASAEEFESSDLNREKVIRPGGSTEIILGPLAPGQYKFMGEFHPDTAKGIIIAK